MTQAKIARVQTSLVKVGTKLIADNRCTCMSNGQLLVVEELNGSLYVPCREGYHFLDGQLSMDGSFYIGFTLVQE